MRKETSKETRRLYPKCNNKIKTHDGKLLTNLAYKTNDHNKNFQVKPSNFGEVIRNTKSQDAMAKELEALRENKTWSTVPFPKGKKAIRSRWV